MRLFLDRLEGDMAVLLTEDGQKLIVPVALAPDAAEGRWYELSLQSVEQSPVQSSNDGL